jgi:hypothetical protein
MVEDKARGVGVTPDRSGDEAQNPDRQSAVHSPQSTVRGTTGLWTLGVYKRSIVPSPVNTGDFGFSSVPVSVPGPSQRPRGKAEIKKSEIGNLK